MYPNSLIGKKKERINLLFAKLYLRNEQKTSLIWRIFKIDNDKHTI